MTASRSPPQVELYGPPFTGKTATLMHVAVNGILPKSLGGNGMTVTWVELSDSSGRRLGSQADQLIQLDQNLGRRIFLLQSG